MRNNRVPAFTYDADRLTEAMNRVTIPRLTQNFHDEIKIVREWYPNEVAINYLIHVGVEDKEAARLSRLNTGAARTRVKACLKELAA